MTRPRALMLVSARVDDELRREVAIGARPRPEYLLLEELHGVELLDWTRLPGGVDSRKAIGSAIHVLTALRRLPAADVIFSDGEHVGIPLALALRGLRLDKPHLVIGHHLTSRSKASAFLRFRADRGMSRILVHSQRQQDLAERDLGIPADKLVVVPYYADTEFWTPIRRVEEPLILAAGREHRDYRTLASACADLDARVFIAAGSLHSPAATESRPSQWPANFELGFADYRALRELYARASVVVVPIIETDFQAGITTLLEAMAMGKAVVSTATRGRAAVIVDGINGLTVPAGDVCALRGAVARLLENPAERARLGEEARRTVVDGHGVEAYARQLAEHLGQLGGAQPLAA